jgi:hypothetical protein
MLTRKLARERWADLVAVARQFVRQAVAYSWTSREERALAPVCSNLTRKVFFLERMPEQVRTALLAMYSRLKNPRGLRGNWVDSFLPSLLAPMLDEVAKLLDAIDPKAEDAKEQRKALVDRWLKEHGLTSLDRFCQYSEEADRVFEWWYQAATGREAWRRVADGERIQAFLQMWLDAYGHNSIARTGHIVFCCEDISILAAKTLEWGRPGAGEIELSTRYVVVSQKGRYPFEEELALLDPVVARFALGVHNASMDAYRTLMGEKMDGVFPQFLRDRWRGVVPEKDMLIGITGESCDVLGNLLDGAMLTSVGIAVSAEAFPQHLKHLYLDGTPEGEALAELIIDEAREVGLGSFVRHERPTPFELANWTYLKPIRPQTRFMAPADAYVRVLLSRVYQERYPHSDEVFESVLARILSEPREDHDKLPSQFESFDANAWGVMSFRGWRDLQRMSFCSHLRGRVTPLLGFYQYPKPAPAELAEAFERIHRLNEDLYTMMMANEVPDEIAEFPMALGNLVPYHAAANVRQWEFVGWQRGDFSVNDEVRVECLGVEKELRRAFPWWHRVSRVEVEPDHYVFARVSKGSQPVVLP